MPLQLWPVQEHLTALPAGSMPLKDQAATELCLLMQLAR